MIVNEHEQLLTAVHQGHGLNWEGAFPAQFHTQNESMIVTPKKK